MSDVDAGSEDSGNPAGDAGQESNWVTGIEDTDLRGWAESKGLQNAQPADALNSYRNLEKMMGADKAGRTVVKPDSTTSDEDRGAFYNSLGRPEEAAGYGFEAPEGAEPEFTDWAKGAFHTAGLSEDQAMAIAGAWNERMEASNTEAATNYASKVEQETATLKQEWGATYDAQFGVAKVTAAQFFSKEAIDAMEGSKGYADVIRAFAKIGGSIGEDKIEGNSNNQSGVMTPAAAAAELKGLQSNREWMEDWMDGSRPGHANAVARKEQLSRLSMGVQ